MLPMILFLQPSNVLSFTYQFIFLTSISQLDPSQPFSQSHLFSFCQCLLQSTSFNHQFLQPQVLRSLSFCFVISMYTFSFLTKSIVDSITSSIKYLVDLVMNKIILFADQLKLIAQLTQPIITLLENYLQSTESSTMTILIVESSHKLKTILSKVQVSHLSTHLRVYLTAPLCP